MSYKKNKGIYVVFMHTVTQNEEGSPVMQETCEFVDRLSNRHMTTATVILELIEGVFVKNRTDNNEFRDYIDYTQIRYPDKFEMLLNITELADKYKKVKTNAGDEDKEIVVLDTEQSVTP